MMKNMPSLAKFGVDTTAIFISSHPPRLDVVMSASQVEIATDLGAAPQALRVRRENPPLSQGLQDQGNILTIPARFRICDEKYASSFFRD